jgi:surface antigen
MCNQYIDVSFAPGQAQIVIKAAQKYLGTPYVDGGGTAAGPTTPTGFGSVLKTAGFDEAGLSLFAYGQAGITLPRSVAAQLGKDLLPRPKLGEEAPADLVFFSDRSDKAPTSVGVVIDPTKGTMIIAAPGDKVRYEHYGTDNPPVGFAHLLADPVTGTVGSFAVGPDGMTFGDCQDYAQYIVRRHVVGMKGSSLRANGADVAQYMRRYGFKVDHNPAVHAVVSFPRSLADATFGHVAMVAGFNKDGSMVVEEFNWDTPNHYGTHVVPKSIINKLTYAHTEVKWSDAVLR